MEIDKIYFDMDGVLADFHRGNREICGIVSCGENAVSDDEMFEAIRKADRFYLHLKPMPGVLELFSDLRKEYGDKVEILTAVPKPSRGVVTAGEDKVEWVRKYLGDEIKVNIVLRKEKPNFVRSSGSILIDDTFDNIESWNARGGTGIWFIDSADARKKLSQVLFGS